LVVLVYNLSTCVASDLRTWIRRSMGKMMWSHMETDVDKSGADAFVVASDGSVLKTLSHSDNVEGLRSTFVDKGSSFSGDVIRTFTMGSTSGMPITGTPISGMPISGMPTGGMPTTTMPQASLQVAGITPSVVNAFAYAEVSSTQASSTTGYSTSASMAYSTTALTASSTALPQTTTQAVGTSQASIYAATTTTALGFAATTGAVEASTITTAPLISTTGTATSGPYEKKYGISREIFIMICVACTVTLVACFFYKVCTKRR